MQSIKSNNVCCTKYHPFMFIYASRTSHLLTNQHIVIHLFLVFFSIGPYFYVSRNRFVLYIFHWFSVIIPHTDSSRFTRLPQVQLAYLTDLHRLKHLSRRNSRILYFAFPNAWTTYSPSLSFLWQALSWKSLERACTFTTHPFSPLKYIFIVHGFYSLLIQKRFLGLFLSSAS